MDFFQHKATICFLIGVFFFLAYFAKRLRRHRRMFNEVRQPVAVKPQKWAKSVIEAGDIIEAEVFGAPGVYTVEEVEVGLNHDHVRHIDIVVLITLSYNDGQSSITCTSIHVKYIKHISERAQAGQK